MTNPGEIRFTPTDISHLNEVRIFDGDGNLKKVVYAPLLPIESSHFDPKNKKYGDGVCRDCNKMFTLSKKRQYSCSECIQKRPLIGLSLRSS